MSQWLLEAGTDSIQEFIWLLTNLQKHGHNSWTLQAKDMSKLAPQFRLKGVLIELYLAIIQDRLTPWNSPLQFYSLSKSIAAFILLPILENSIKCGQIVSMRLLQASFQTYLKVSFQFFSI